MDLQLYIFSSTRCRSQIINFPASNYVRVFIECYKALCLALLLIDSYPAYRYVREVGMTQSHSMMMLYTKTTITSLTESTCAINNREYMEVLRLILLTALH